LVIEETALKAGDEIAEYRIDKVLGAGSFGVTYLATDTGLSRRVAIKEYLPADYARRDSTGQVSSRNAETAPTFEWGLDRFTEEARTLAQFSHPNIVRVLHIVQNLNGTAYIVMELLEGQDFEQVVEQQGALKVDRFQSVFRQLLNGMQAVHELGVLHRDIKPSNIMLKGETPVLIDFGAARALATQRKVGFSALVTDGYSPLEQYSSQNIQSEASDIYALAATAHYLLTGQIPPMPAARLAGDAIRTTAEIAPDLPDDIAKAIDWGLSLQMAERPQAIRDWRAAMPSLDAVPAAEAEIVYIDRGEPAINRRAMLLGGAGLVLAAGAGSFLLLRDTSISSSGQPLAPQWTKDISTLFSEPFAGIAMSGEHVMLAAYEFSASGEDRALASKVDSEGKEIARFVLSEPGSRAHTLLPTDDGGAYLGGEIGAEAMITRLDPNFRPLWTRKFESGSISSIMTSKNGLIAGLEGPASSGKAKLLFINAEGALTADVTLLDRRGDSIQRIAALHDGSIAVLGMRIENRVIAGGKAEVASLWLAKVAQTGEELWRVAESGLGIAHGWGLIEAGSNIYVTGRTKALDAASPTKLLAMRVSGDGEKVWSRWDYAGEPASGRSFGLSANGDLYVASWSGAPYRARISQIGPNGDLLWDSLADDKIGFADAYAGLTVAEDGSAYAVYLKSDTENDLKLAIRKFA
jgi:serine/threonine protein kinase